VEIRSFSKIIFKTISNFKTKQKTYKFTFSTLKQNKKTYKFTFSTFNVSTHWLCVPTPALNKMQLVHVFKKSFFIFAKQKYFLKRFLGLLGPLALLMVT
jgi:hypothetical protein